MRVFPLIFSKRVRLLAGFMAASVMLLLLPSRLTAPARALLGELPGPGQALLMRVGGDAAAAGGSISEMYGARRRERVLAVEVERLRNQVRRLRDDVAQARSHVEAVQALTLLRPRVRIVRAPVASYDSSALRRSITVRAGTRHGVRPGLAVTSSGALVGVTTECGPWQSRVRLTTDPGSAVACRLMHADPDVHPGARPLAILTGTGADEHTVEWLGPKEFPERGDFLMTTSLSHGQATELLIPDGVPAARIVSVEPDPMTPLYLAVRAEPYVNLARLEYVEVLVIDREDGSDE
jgi:cell shape-determining protein MreC